MRRHVASAALLNLSLIVGASAQTAPPRAPSPPAAPKMDCPMHDRAGGHMMQSGAMPMQQGRPMPGRWSIAARCMIQPNAGNSIR